MTSIRQVEFLEGGCNQRRHPVASLESRQSIENLFRSRFYKALGIASRRPRRTRPNPPLSLSPPLPLWAMPVTPPNRKEAWLSVEPFPVSAYVGSLKNLKDLKNTPLPTSVPPALTPISVGPSGVPITMLPGLCTPSPFCGEGSGLWVKARVFGV